jgi:predicted small secreted protein
MKKLIAFACVSASLLAITGCRTGRGFGFEATGERVTILSEPSGAEVYQKLPPPGTAPRLIGKTPLVNIIVPVVTTMKGGGLSPAAAQDMARMAGNLVVEVRKDGYKPCSAVLAIDPERTLEHRIVLEPEPAE